MTPDELRETLARLGLTTGQAARLLAVSDRAVRNWQSGGRPIPGLVPRVLGLIEHMPKVREALARHWEKEGR